MSEEEDNTEANEVSPEETEIHKPELDDSPEDAEWNPFEETDDDFKPTRVKVVKAEDGLPTQAVDGTTDDDIPPLSPETLVCMEDTSEFVIRDDYMQITNRFKPSEVERKPNGKYYLKAGVHKVGVSEVQTSEQDPIEVQPIRPRCAHYVRQMGQGSLNSAMKEHYRLCSARRTTEGAFMSVRNQALWACTMRSPRDPDSEEKLEDFDEKKIAEGAQREYYSIFGKA